MNVKKSLRSVEYALKLPVFNAVGALAGSVGLRLEKPLFVIGTGRSGTTLLVQVLRSHPQLKGYPREANELWHPNSFPIERARIDTPPIVVDPKRFTELSVANWPSDQEQIIRRIFTGFHVLTGRQRMFFSKSALVAFLIPKMVQMFPDARFVHIYRAGPPVINSMCKKNYSELFSDKFTEEDYYFYAAHYYNDSLLEIDRAARAYSLAPDKLVEVSYENFCEKPRRVLEKLSEFIGVDSAGFRFDLSSIQSANYKVGDYQSSRKWDQILEIIKPAMELKGYV